MRRGRFYVLHFAFSVFLLAGCFKEPVPAYKTVDPASRVYLKEGAGAFSPALLLEKGRVFTEDKGYVPLSDFRADVDPSAIDYLNLDRCAFTNVDELAAFTGLRWLRLNENKLDSIPEAFSGMKKLERIYLRGNPLAEVPRALEGMDSLRTVDLSETGISEIPGWFAAKKGLEHLTLSRTRIRKLPGDLSAWRSLKSLQLGDIPGIDEKEMRRIRAALPGTAVVF